MNARAPLSSASLRVAVIGSGISGLAAAHALAPHAAVTLYEAGGHFGGHANTVDVELEGVRHGVDTGFLVFNHRTYPGLTALFKRLGVETAPSAMSFSVQARAPWGPLEWSGTSLASVFAQPGNALRPGFWRMLADLLRFNALATRIASTGLDAEMQQPLGLFLQEQGYSREFRDWYLLPMTACIWSMPTEAMLRFPAGTLIRFCHNHGLLQIADRPQWYTVKGGSQRYVEKIIQGLPDARLRTPVREVSRTAEGVTVTTDGLREHFDRVVFANHARDALALLRDPSAEEREMLGAIGTQPNRAVLHTDASVLPRDRKAWAAWNYESSFEGRDPRVCLHYLINELQPLPWKTPVIVSLNPIRPIAADRVIGEFDYAHPVFDEAAIAAQERLPRLQGVRGTYYCGAWTGYGFHEDGLASGTAAARSILTRRAMQTAEAFA